MNCTSLDLIRRARVHALVSASRQAIAIHGEDSEQEVVFLEVATRQC